MKKILTLFTGLLLTGTALHAQWNNIATDGMDYRKIAFTSASTGYLTKTTSAGSAWNIARTTDGGNTWTNLPFNPILHPRDFSFINDNVGFVCADTVSSSFPYTLSVYKTTDGGSTWSFVYTFPTGVPVDSDIYFTDTLHGVVAETYGRVWYTADGGVSWTSQDIGGYYPQQIEFSSPSVGYITCADGTFGYFGVVLKTTDGGATWNEVFNFADIPQNYSSAGTVDFLDNNNGYMMTLEYFYKTTDGGITWDSLPYTFHNGIYFQDICFISLTEGYGCDSQGGIYKTTDGGETWTIDRAADMSTWLYSMDISGGNAFAAGSNGRLLRKSGVNAVHEQEEQLHLQVYPNPSGTGLFYLDKKEQAPLDIQVYGLTGGLVWQQNAHTGNSVDLSALNNGVYVLHYARTGDLSGYRTQRLCIAR